MLEDVFDVPVFALQGAEDFVDEGAIFYDEEVGVEDAGVLGSDGARNAGLHFEDLLTGLDQGGFKPGYFPGHFPFFNAPGGGGFFFGPEDEYSSPSDAGRYAYTMETPLNSLLGFAHCGVMEPVGFTKL